MITQTLTPMAAPSEQAPRASMRQTIKRRFHALKVKLAERPAKYLARRYDAGQGLAARLLSVFDAPHPPEQPDQQLLVPSEPIPWVEPKFPSSGKEAQHALTRMKTDGCLRTTPAGIISADNMLVSFPNSMHWWHGRLFEEAFLNSNLLTNPKYVLDLWKLRFSRKQLLSEAILLSLPWHHNFYHWMIEMLPRLALVERAGNLGHLKLLVPKSSPAYVRESLELCGWADRVQWMPDGAYQATRLHIPTRLAVASDVPPAALYWLHRTMPQAASPTRRRLYVSRADARNRFVTNEAELHPLLQKHGFETVRMSEHSVAEQVQLFRQADIVIGSHGAAFANLAFMQPGGKFIEFFESGFFNRAYHRICSTLGIDYGFLVGAKEGMGYRIEPDELEATIQKVLA